MAWIEVIGGYQQIVGVIDGDRTRIYAKSCERLATACEYPMANGLDSFTPNKNYLACDKRRCCRWVIQSYTCHQQLFDKSEQLYVKSTTTYKKSRLRICIILQSCKRKPGVCSTCQASGHIRGISWLYRRSEAQSARKIWQLFFVLLLFKSHSESKWIVPKWLTWFNVSVLTKKYDSQIGNGKMEKRVPISLYFLCTCGTNAAREVYVVSRYGCVPFASIWWTCTLPTTCPGFTWIPDEYAEYWASTFLEF